MSGFAFLNWRKLLCFLVVCSLGCTCLLTNALAQESKSIPPCHVIAMGSDDEPAKENCCTDKMEARREVARITLQDFQFDNTVIVALAEQPYWQLTEALGKEHTLVTVDRIAPPWHIDSWNTVRLIL